MIALWLPTLIPLLMAGIIAGIIAVIIAIWVWFQPIDGGKVGDHPLARWGCAAVILLLVAVLFIPFSWFRDSDAELFEEIFGFPTNMAEQDMLADAFGGGYFRRGESRAIYMAAGPGDDEIHRILHIEGLAASDMTAADFAAEGEKRGFVWWTGQRRTSAASCQDGQIYQSTKFRDWSRVLIADCPDRLYIYANRHPANTR